MDISEETQKQRDSQVEHIVPWDGIICKRDILRPGHAGCTLGYVPGRGPYNPVSQPF